jgi:hypothetical protein
MALLDDLAPESPEEERQRVRAEIYDRYFGEAARRASERPAPSKKSESDEWVKVPGFGSYRRTPAQDPWTPMRKK